MDARTLPKPQGGARDRVRQVSYLFLALEAGRPVTSSARFALGDVDVVEIGRGGSRRALRTGGVGGRTLRIEIPDAWMSQTHARVIRRGSEHTFSDAGSRNGSLLNDAAVDSAVLRDGDRLEIGGTFFVFRTPLPELGEPDVVSLDPDRAGIPRLSRTVVPALAARVQELARIADSDVSVVVHGPSGTGKEIVARSVHELSGRRGAFVAVNCGALPAGLVESELFGYRRGAFSGATADKLGLIPAADGGTLFLDEIGDLPAAVQPALLRALQERAVRPVGATEPVPVDFRLVSATHRDLDAMVRTGRFREDLWARLSGFTLELPPLRARREDLETLIADLGQRVAGGRGLTLTAEAARALLAHDWPRNIRELERSLGAAVALAGDGEIDLVHLPGMGASEPGPAPEADDDDPRREQLVEALRAHHGNVSAAARALGRPRSQIQRWMRRWGLRPDGG